MSGVRRVALALLFPTLAACSAAAPAVHPPAATVVSQTASALGRVSSVQLDFTFGGGLTLQGFKFVSAQASLTQSAARVVFKIEQSGLLVDLTLVSVGGASYIQLPFTKFTPLTPAQAADLPSLSSLIAPDGGLARLLTSAQSPTWVGTGTLDGIKCDVIDVGFSPAAVTAALGPAAKPPATLKAEIWSGSSDHLIRRLILKGQITASGPAADVQIDASAYNQAQVVATPSPLA